MSLYFYCIIECFWVIPLSLPTVHITVTFGLSLSTLIGITIIGLFKFRANFMSLFVPGGAPLVLAPF